MMFYKFSANYTLKVPDRTANTLIAAIKANILPGTTIYSDVWREYSTPELEAGINYFHTLLLRSKIRVQTLIIYDTKAIISCKRVTRITLWIQLPIRLIVMQNIYGAHIIGEAK